MSVELTELCDKVSDSDCDTIGQLLNGLTIDVKELRQFEELHVKMGVHIGSGSYSNVYKCRYKSSNVALKVCLQTDKSIKRLVTQELSIYDILKEKPHKNIIRFLGTFESSDKTRVMILMELFDGIDFAEKLMRNGKPFEEIEAKEYFKQMVDGLQFLHNLSIVHRDIKLDNILIGQEHNTHSSKECVKIIDFGFSKIVELKDKKAPCKSRLGTEVYMAPELADKFTEEYDAFKSDIFSLAIVLYVLLFDAFPDRKDNNSSNNNYKEIQFPEDNKIKVSENAKQIILNMSLEDPIKRFGINQILDSDWMKSSN